MARVQAVRRRIAIEGLPRVPEQGPNVTKVTLPEPDCDLVRDLLVAEGAATVVEVGLAYGSSALAVGEALAAVDAPQRRHVVIDPFQDTQYDDVGWQMLREAGLDDTVRLMRSASSVALPQLVHEGLVADAAFVDGSHRFHEVFVDLYFLRQLVRPGGLVLVDDDWAPAVRTAVRYFEHNLAWAVLPKAFTGGTVEPFGGTPGADTVTRCRALRLPGERFEPPFEDFRPF